MTDFCLSCSDAILVSEEEIDSGTCASCRKIERNNEGEVRALNFDGPRKERFVDGMDEFIEDQAEFNPEPEDVGLDIDGDECDDPHDEEADARDRGC